MDPFLGEIRIVGFNYAPQGWALCQGQTLSISQNTALFSLLGTQFGGNGVNTFNLPDLRGRVPVGQGSGPGLSPAVMGQSAGIESVMLTANQLPAHTHLLKAATAEGDTRDPNGAALSKEAAGVTASYKTGATLDATLDQNSLSSAGGSQPVNVQSPYLVVNCIIALQGIYPSHQ